MNTNVIHQRTKITPGGFIAMLLTCLILAAVAYL